MVILGSSWGHCTGQPLADDAASHRHSVTSLLGCVPGCELLPDTDGNGLSFCRRRSKATIPAAASITSNSLNLARRSFRESSEIAADEAAQLAATHPHISFERATDGFSQPLVKWKCRLICANWDNQDMGPEY